MFCREDVVSRDSLRGKSNKQMFFVRIFLKYIIFENICVKGCVTADAVERPESCLL